MGLTFEMLGVILHRNRNPNISSTCSLFTCLLLNSYVTVAIGMPFPSTYSVVSDRYTHIKRWHSSPCRLSDFVRDMLGTANMCVNQLEYIWWNTYGRSFRKPAPFGDFGHTAYLKHLPRDSSHICKNADVPEYFLGDLVL